MQEARKLKRAVIKEEYLEITGRFQSALILNQLIYWTERTHDFDRFLEEENERNLSEGLDPVNVPLRRGWIYKSASQLSQELMLGVSDQTIARYMKELIALGFVQERSNPVHRWDRTRQYRVDMVRVQKSLSEKGYSLSGWLVPAAPSFSKMENADSDLEIQTEKTENVNFHFGNAIPETTTETETETAAAAPPEKNFLLRRKKSGAYRMQSTEIHPPPAHSGFAALPSDVLTPSLERILHRKAAKHGPAYVEDSIRYANANVKDPRKYRYYLEKTLEGGWGEGYQAPPPPPPKPVTVIELHEASEILGTGNRTAFDTYCKNRNIPEADIRRILSFCARTAGPEKLRTLMPRSAHLPEGRPA
ncbi:MAG: hypothetical protein R2941_25220 [Desulfobacterales bacterium]